MGEGEGEWEGKREGEGEEERGPRDIPPLSPNPNVGRELSVHENLFVQMACTVYGTLTQGCA